MSTKNLISRATAGTLANKRGAASRRTEKRAFIKAGLIVGILLSTLIGLGAYTQYKQQEAARIASVQSPAMPPPPSPQFAANQLAKQYIYAGGKLIAVEDGSGSPPADIAVWRPSTGVWYVMGGQGSQETTVTWGISTDKPVQGDYDGDDKTDFSVYRPSTGEWFVLNSTNNALTTYNWGGAADDRPAQADYDGDGKTDVAVFRPSNGHWYIRHSANGAFIDYQWGNSTDIPASADYDGDGRADMGVWRGGDTSFYSLNSTDNAPQVILIGQASNEPVPGDYDGDGKADYAIRNAANWIVRKSSTLQTETVSWQQAGDKAVHNDYDGDSRVDVAVWRESTGVWYIRQSSRIGLSDELRQNTWGSAGDIPVPSFYRR